MALDEALVATKNRLKIGKGNQRLSLDLKSNEATIQVVLNALKLTLCLSRKATSLDTLRLSRAQILWGMYTMKYVDYVSLLWEDLVYQVENKNAKKNNDMYYPRFTNVIIDFYISKDQSISRRNKMFWHTTRDDRMFNTIRVISRYQDTQIYEANLYDVLTSQDMLESKAYKEYYAFATGAVPLKEKTAYKKKAKEHVTSKTASESISKGPRLKTQAKTKQPAKKTKAKGLTMLTKAALFEAGQLKLATKRSKKDFHISHASGSGDGVGKLSKVPDEQEQEDTDTDEGTDTLSGVRDVPKYEFESDMESWGDSEEKDDDDDDGNNDDEGGNDDEGDDVVESDDEQTKSKNDDDGSDEEVDVEESTHTKTDKVKFDYEESNDDDESTNNEDDEEVKELYDDADEPLRSSSVSFDFTSKFLNLENSALTNTEIASLMKTSTSQDTIPPTPPTLFTPVTQQQQTPTLPTTTSTTIPELLDFAFVFKFDKRVSSLEIELSELKQTNQFTKAISSIPGIVDKYLASKMKEAVDVATTYAVAASLSELELKKIVMDKMEANKSIERANTQRTLYNALVASYNSEKYIISSYGYVVLLKRGHDDKDKDQDPFVESDRGMKRRRAGKDADSSKDFRSKEKRSTSSSKKASKSRHTSSGKSVHSEEPSHNVEDTSKHQDQEHVIGETDEQPDEKKATKADWFKKPERPPTPDSDWSKRRQIDFQAPQTWISQAARTEEPPASFDEFNATMFDFSALVLNRLQIPNLTQELQVEPAFNLLKGTCKSLTESEYHLEECSKETTEKLEWNNSENKPYPFNLRKPLPLIQDLDEWYDLNVAVCMYTRHIVIQRRVEDLQLGVESYQKKLNLTKPNSYRSHLRDRTAYTSHSDPHGIIYLDQSKRKRLMRTDEMGRLMMFVLIFMILMQK
nr:hypothetical protein [Tanacetum cinerariifolium]